MIFMNVKIEAEEKKNRRKKQQSISYFYLEKVGCKWNWGWIAKMWKGRIGNDITGAFVTWRMSDKFLQHIIKELLLRSNMKCLLRNFWNADTRRYLKCKNFVYLILTYFVNQLNNPHSRNWNYELNIKLNLMRKYTWSIMKDEQWKVLSFHMIRVK